MPLEHASTPGGSLVYFLYDRSRSKSAARRHLAPPPTANTPAAPPTSRADWFRPALWLGVAFNLLACWPALELLKEPYGSEQMSDDLDAWPHVVAMFAAGLAVVVGVPIAVWQMRSRQGCYQSVALEWFALAFCLMPYPVACAVLSAIRSAKAFDSLG